MNGTHLRWGALHSIVRVYEAGSVIVFATGAGSAGDGYAARGMDTAGPMITRRARPACAVAATRAVISAARIAGPAAGTVAAPARTAAGVAGASRRTAVGAAAGRTAAGRTAGTAA